MKTVSEGAILKWNSQHGRLEKWDKRMKRHLGEFASNTGEMLKKPDSGKRIPKFLDKRGVMYDISGVKRCIAGYEKTEPGYRKVFYYLKPIPLSLLQRLFNVPTEHKDLGIVHMIGCYDICEKRAKVLRKYIDGEIDLNKYDYMLQCHASDE